MQIPKVLNQTSLYPEQLGFVCDGEQPGPDKRQGGAACAAAFSWHLRVRHFRIKGTSSALFKVFSRDTLSNVAEEIYLDWEDEK